MIVRYITAGVIAFGVTYGLFFLMQAIISMEEGQVGKDSHGKVIEFVDGSRNGKREGTIITWLERHLEWSTGPAEYRARGRIQH